MWYQVFLWGLFSSIFVHIVASLIAFGRLRKHTIGRFVPVAIFVMGFIAPLTGGVITSMHMLFFTQINCRLFLKDISSKIVFNSQYPEKSNKIIK